MKCRYCGDRLQQSSDGIIASLDRPGDPFVCGSIFGHPIIHVPIQGHRFAPGTRNCNVCGGSERSLTTECVGRALSPRVLDAVHTGQIDYRNGWTGKPSPHSIAASSL